MWIKNNEPDKFKRTYKFLQAKDFIAARMTGNFYTDYSDASGTNLFDINNLTWSDEIIEAAKNPVGSSNLLYLPYLMGERSPHWNPLAKGAFIGLSIKHTRNHMIRAVMEGLALNLKIILDAFIEQGAEIDKIRLIGGGAKGNVWRRILADVFNKTIVIPNLLDETTSMGAALNRIYPAFKDAYKGLEGVYDILNG